MYDPDRRQRGAINLLGRIDEVERIAELREGLKFGQIAIWLEEQLFKRVELARLFEVQQQTGHRRLAAELLRGHGRSVSAAIRLLVAEPGLYLRQHLPLQDLGQTTLVDDIPRRFLQAPARGQQPDDAVADDGLGALDLTRRDGSDAQTSNFKRPAFPDEVCVHVGHEATQQSVARASHVNGEAALHALNLALGAPAD